MIGLLQRVSEAAVSVDGEQIAAIGRGILVLVGVERGDTDTAADRLAERLLGYRVFADEDGKMNRDVIEIDGGVLLVSQFTLAADTGKGRRASFTTAAPPAEAERLFDRLVAQVRARHTQTATGRFGANMQVRLVNDGPVTFRLRVEP
ncbi:MAG TPA: D-aminoacyl-tRNA deacylase [Gammaproteobacteria bacterium]|nr:D-aminoacyl-tRNA deacylase [Gammaproteobacteria bacterium]